MNKKLKKLYESKWDNLISNSKNTDATYPLLIKVDKEYQNSDIRVMIIGQETDGWCGVLEEHKKEIASVQDTYFNYLYNSTDKNRRPFWNRKNFKYFQEELTKKLSPKNISFIWNNVSKIGKNNRGKPTIKIEELEKQYFNVFEDELKILKPNIIIFTTGNRKIPVKHEKLQPIKEKPVAEIKFENYENIIAVRTYHPNAQIKGGKRKFKEDIVNLIIQRYNKIFIN